MKASIHDKMKQVAQVTLVADLLNHQRACKRKAFVCLAQGDLVAAVDSMAEVHQIDIAIATERAKAYTRRVCETTMALNARQTKPVAPAPKGWDKIEGGLEMAK